MEKREMYNACADLEGYNCFGCSPKNPYGLKCKFTDEGEYVTCHWLPSENDVIYLVYPEEIARKKLDWPGVEAFYKSEKVF